MDEPAPELTEEEFDAHVARAGLQLTPAETTNVLAAARRLRRSAAMIKAYNGQARRSGDDAA
jgi:hypothetical protein